MALWKLKKKQLWYAYQKVFDIHDEHSKMVLVDMCRAHHVFDSTFDSDPYQHAFNAGEANTVLRILTLLKLSPDEIADLPED